MHRVAVIAGLSLALGTACPTNVPMTSGYAMPEFFAFDGACRSWDFVNEDTSIPYKMVGVLQPEVTTSEDGFTRIYTIDYHSECVGAEECDNDVLLRSITLSTSTAAGTLVYEFDVDGSSAQSFDPPLQLTEGRMEATQAVTSTSGGTTMTSEMAQLAPCEILWDEWDGCVLLDVDDGGAAGMTGTWTIAPGWNIVAWDLGVDGGRWRIDRAFFSGSATECEDEGLPVLE